MCIHPYLGVLIGIVCVFTPCLGVLICIVCVFTPCLGVLIGIVCIPDSAPYLGVLCVYPWLRPLSRCINMSIPDSAPC